MNKILKTVLCVGLVLGIVGCGSSAGDSQTAKSETQTVESNEFKGLIIEESGYFLTNNTDPYILYSVKLTNQNEKYYVNFAKVNITAYDAEGKILASTDYMWGDIAPGESAYFAGQADYNGIVPAKVEFKVANIKDDYSENTKANLLTELEVSNTNIVHGDLSSSVTGVVKNTMEEDIGSAWVSVIFYKEGVMIGGEHSFSEAVSAGGEMPFDISIYHLPEGYDDYRVYAYTWY